jgi:hypothetical protein
VRWAQVVSKRGRAGQRARLVGAGQQVVDKVSAQTQLGLGEAALVSQVDGQHHRGVLQGEQLEPAGPPLRVDQREHPEHLVAGLRERQDPVALAHR